MKFCYLGAVVMLSCAYSSIGLSAQTVVDSGVKTVTLYSSLKYQRTDLPPLRTGKLYGDSRRDHMDLVTGELKSKFDDPRLRYGYAYLGENLDWIGVLGERDDLTVIRDLGEHSWNEKIKIPSLAALPKLRPGEKRVVTLNTSGKAGRNGADGRSGNYDNAFNGTVLGSELGTPDFPPDPSHAWPGPNTAPGPAKIKTVDLPVLVRALPGHMYAVHVVNATLDFYVLLHVDSVVRGDNCTLSWKRL